MRARSLIRQTRASFSTSAITRNARFDVHPEVQEALAHRKPVVALETAIVTHGMPFPTNLETARTVENIVRSNGAVPATVGLINGRVKIGLESSELDRLADPGNSKSVVKVSRRDIGAAMAMKKDGGTTCSGTMVFAELAGIKVFATGGLGGVHRGGENSMDVSADLQELARSQVALVSAGAKSILDIGRTLEYLETLGVPVLSYAKTKDFPAFFVPRSGFMAPWNTDDPRVVAQVMFSQWQLGIKNGVFIGVPIPEEFEAAGIEIQLQVEQAIRESEENGVSKSGKEATPWILKRVAELTQGKSLPSNIALIKNTALVGSKIAGEYLKLSGESQEAGVDNTRIYSTGTREPSETPTEPTGAHSPEKEHVLLPPKLLVFGSAAIDITAQTNPTAGNLGTHSTSPGRVSISLGGVGRNVAEAAHRLLKSRSSDLSAATLVVSPIGHDPFGRLLVHEMNGLGMRIDGLTPDGSQRTAVCNMVIDSIGGLLGGVADMDAIHSLDGATAREQIKTHKPDIICFDGNLHPDALKELVHYANEHHITTFFEPTSVIKSTAILPAIASSLDRKEASGSPITFASPNLLELAQMYQAAREEPYDLLARQSWWDVIDNFSLGSEYRNELERLARLPASVYNPSGPTLSFLVEKGIAQMAIHLLPLVQNLVIKCGDIGVIVAMRITGADVLSSGWLHKPSDPKSRCLVAHGRELKELVVLKHYPAAKVDPNTIVNVTGAGDSLVGSLLATLVENPNAFMHPASLDAAVDIAQRAAVLTLQSKSAVSPRLDDMHTGNLVI